MKKITTKIATLLFLFLVPLLSLAQDLPPDDTLDTPIDSWLVVLIIIAVGIGVKKGWEMKKRQVKLLEVKK